jgi:hypothetical protein
VTYTALDGAREHLSRDGPSLGARGTMQPLGRRRIEVPRRHLGHYEPWWWSGV